MKPGFLRGLQLVAATLFAIMPALVLANEAGDTAAQLNSANAKASETSQRISDLDSQLSRLQAQISDTQTNIAATNQAIAEAKARMAVQQATLAELIQAEYKHNQQTDLELLVGSHTFADFVDKQEYLENGQDKIADAVNAVVETKKQLDDKAADLGHLNAQLVATQNGLNYTRAQAQNQLDQVNAMRDQLKAKLARYGGRVVNVGDHVNAGDLIGFEGTSGCSTGPHLHFEVDQNGSPVNPRSFTPGRLRWPLDSGFGVNQEFGRPNWSAPYSFHTGIDMAQYFGAPVYAAGSGVVKFSGYDRSGFGDHVIIDHGGGIETVYGHLGARASDYPNC